MKALRNQLWSLILLVGMVYEFIMPERWLRHVWGGRWKRNPRET